MNTHSSTCNNILALDILINNFRISLINCYGPPQLNNHNFFPEIKDFILSMNNETFLLAGDLNSIPTNIQPSDQPLLNNLDVLNMSSLPNPIHCRNLCEWVSSNFALDLFRFHNPKMIDFSYVPFSTLKTNRSRIDIMLVSPNLSEVINCVEYVDSKLTILDHKTLLATSFSKKSNKLPTIDTTLLNIEGLFDNTKFSLYELILQHFDLPNKQFLIEILPNINLLSKEIVLLSNSHFCHDAFVKLWLFEKQSRLNEFCNHFPPIPECLTYPCNLGPELLLDILLNQINNSVISFQASYIKSQKEEKYNLSKELFNLKNSNCFSEATKNMIFDLEKKLTSIEDNQVLRHMENAKHFSILNYEKGSKPFAKLLNNSNKSNNLSLIKDDNSRDFKSVSERNEYLAKSYEKKFDSENFKPNVSIANFFGDKINHPLIQSHKLNDNEKSDLDIPISLDELDKSLSESNFDSAPGQDGLHIRVLAKFWDFLRGPLLKALNAMISNKKLSSRMRYTKIRLIKKNGNVDLSKLCSLRPISVVSSIYKIFSGVIDNRLKKVIHKVVYKSQKAYSNTYSIQEGLIYSNEIIQKALNTDTNLNIINLHFNSAFDSLGHSYIIDVLKFFNFGDYFINLVDTCFKDRFAYIITDEGITRNFKIGLGCLQGDRPSGNFFKISVNPLILYLTISPEISLPPELPFILPPNQPPPDNNSFFADDGNVFTKVSTVCLLFCYNTLINFGNLSGLSINSKKTKLCIIGTPPPPDFVELSNNLGFKIVDNFKSLGISFDKTLTNMQSNWTKVIQKIVKIRNFWSIFHLSTPGKLNVVKTFMLPQLCYLGSVITPSKENIVLIEEIICSFINQSGIISRDKIFSPISQGGLGIPKVDIFLKSLDILLFKKSLIINDTWAKEIHKNAVSHNFLFYYPENLNLPNNPVLKRVIHSFVDFQSSFWVNNGNIKDLRIFENKDFCNNFGNKLSRAFFTLPTWCQFHNQIINLRFEDVIDLNNRALTFEGFFEKTNIVLNHNEFFRLQSITRQNIVKYSSKFTLPQLKIDDFLKRPNKKSKHFRAFFEFNTFHIEKCRTTINRYKWVDLNEVDLNRELRLQSTCHLSFLTINLKDFCFKMLNNQLKFNANLVHFVDNKSAECTFCVLENRRPAPKEVTNHFFITCPTSNTFYTNYFNKFLEHKPFDFSPDWILTGAPSNLHQSLAYILNIELLIVSLFLFNSRTKKILPNAHNVEHFVRWNRTLLKKNAKYSINYALFSNPFDPG